MKYFEPEDPILTAEDFTRELLLWREREGNDLWIVSEGMAPVVELEGQRYRCQLEQPRTMSTGNAVVSALSFVIPTMGYKAVYFHPIPATEE